MKLPRFRFSLVALLLLMMWSAVVLWLNTTPRIVHFHSEPSEYKECYGWPFVYEEHYPFWRKVWGDGHFGPWPRKLAGDAVIGILVVVVLTWGSTFLLNRLRRPPTSDVQASK